MGRVGSPKVVTTATSVWRTWKVNSSSAKIKISTGADDEGEKITFHGDFEVLGGVAACGEFLEIVRINLLLQIVGDHILRVSGEQTYLRTWAVAAAKVWA